MKAAIYWYQYLLACPFKLNSIHNPHLPSGEQVNSKDIVPGRGWHQELLVRPTPGTGMSYSVTDHPFPPN